MAPSAVDELWSLALDRQHIDPAEVWRALEKAATSDEPLDYRSRVLVRDTLSALSANSTLDQVQLHLGQIDQRGVLASAWSEQFDRVGFPSLERRIVQTTKPETIYRFFRELGSSLTSPSRLVVGGSIVLILEGYLHRRTEDIDAVDEIPEVIRVEHELLRRLVDQYQLQLTHFQSHYLPTGWETRVKHLDTFGRLQISLVDPIDIFVGKLFSVRMKDRDDLRVLANQLDRATIENRVRETTAAFRSEAKLADAAQKNWYIVYGDELPI